MYYVHPISLEMRPKHVLSIMSSHASLLQTTNSNGTNSVNSKLVRNINKFLKQCVNIRYNKATTTT